MTLSGKQKMAHGWVALFDDPEYKDRFYRVLGVVYEKAAAPNKSTSVFGAGR
jgi:hypothetical protein